MADKVTHFELPADNLERAQTFYRNGGMLARQRPVMSPVITIQVKSIDESLQQIEKLGGWVVRKKEPVAQMGFAAYFADTEGNVLGLWQSA